MKHSIAAAILCALVGLTMCGMEQGDGTKATPLFPDPHQPRDGFQTVEDVTHLTPCGILTQRAMTRLRFELSEKDRTCTFQVTTGEARLNSKPLAIGKPNVAAFEAARWKDYQSAYRKYQQNLEAEKAVGPAGEGQVQQIKNADQPSTIETRCGQLLFQGQVGWVENQEKQTCRVRVFKGNASISGSVLKPGEEVVVPFKLARK